MHVPHHMTKWGPVRWAAGNRHISMTHCLGKFAVLKQMNFFYIYSNNRKCSLKKRGLDLVSCIGSMWHVLVSGRLQIRLLCADAEVAFISHRLISVWLQEGPADGQNGANQQWWYIAFVITYLRKCKNGCAAGIGREDWEHVRATALRTQRSVRKEREDMVKCWSIDSPAACGGDCGKAACLPAAHEHPWAVGNPCWRRLLAGPVAPWRD